ncbi:methylglyoxal synthase [Hyaloraphidium curvatum]|nr:methylglyoxal synthase [Hyaloraphidium curvatum]
MPAKMPAPHPLPARKRIALVAHDNMKSLLLKWAAKHRDALARHELFGTGTTGGLASAALDLPVHRFLSGPLGGDQQIGAAIAEGRLDVLVFFWDPLEAQPHDPDVKALLRLVVLYDVPCAMSPAAADFLVTSGWLDLEYPRAKDGEAA